MGDSSIYIDREDCNSVEAETRNLFIRGILEELGVPEEALTEVWPELELTVKDKLKLRTLLSKLDIEIVDDGDRGLKVYTDDTLLAEWFKPKFILREDKGARTLAGKLYYEMVVRTWSVFDQENDEEDNTD